MNRGMRLCALPTDAVYVTLRAGGQNFLDLAEAQGGAESAREPDGLFRLSLRQFADGAKRGVNAVDGEAHRMREVRIQQKEFGHAKRSQFSRVGFAVRLER